MRRKPDQMPLLEVVRPRLLWTLSASMEHYSDGAETAVFTRKYMEPYQVLSEHIQDIPVGWQLDCGRLSRFQAAVSMVAYGKQVSEILRLGAPDTRPLLP
jgi:hypothetical protein